MASMVGVGGALHNTPGHQADLASPQGHLPGKDKGVWFVSILQIRMEGTWAEGEVGPGFWKGPESGRRSSGLAMPPHICLPCPIPGGSILVIGSLLDVDAWGPPTTQLY